MEKGRARRRKSAWLPRRKNRSDRRLKMRGCMRPRSRTEGMTRREEIVVCFVRGEVMPSSKASTQRSKLFALERQ